MLFQLGTLGSAMPSVQGFPNRRKPRFSRSLSRLGFTSERFTEPSYCSNFRFSVRFRKPVL
uniref:Uncharacterized protein n=1 Tax=Arundo donax TaxID=35708 RepID=A0A0A9EVT5_ARUDO